MKEVFDDFVSDGFVVMDKMWGFIYLYIISWLMRRLLWSGIGNCEMNFIFFELFVFWLRILDFWVFLSVVGVIVSLKLF